MNNLKIKTKLILLFVLIKVIPLLLLSYIAIDGAKNLNKYFEETTQNTFDISKNIIKNTATTAISDSIKALDQKSQFTLERLSYEIANNVATFLYERDHDLLLLSQLTLNDNVFKKFQQIKTAQVTLHGEYLYNKKLQKWEEKISKKEEEIFYKANLKDNENSFHQNESSKIKYIKIPLYKEIQFINLKGDEIYKISTLNKQKINVQNKQNTYCKAETYFENLQTLKKGEIYVSNVIGAYVKSNVIGTFTESKAKKMNTPFAPENNAYAGKENPVGKRFEGIIRFATPVYKNEKKIGYVAFALDHRHIMEFTDSFDPLPENTKQDIADASSGNYAFMWDYAGRNISHARDYFIVGYDKNTGKQVPGWISADIAQKFKNSKVNDLNQFLKTYPLFEKQSLKKKPNMTQLKELGQVGLDCRYLNFAPQCEGWMQLTKKGGYGSFEIFWSGVNKLTTAATIPYYTGQYANSKRGFGFVTLGANVDEFHLAANETKKDVDVILKKQVDNMKTKLTENKNSILHYIDNISQELIVVTFLMVLIIIAIAIWMSNIVTNKISNLLIGTKEYLKHNFNHRIAITSKDEIGELEHSFNTMAKAIKQHIAIQKNTNILLDIKVKEANSALQAKSNFLATMSHEIRTPMNAILGFIWILKKKETDEGKIKYLDIMQKSGNDLLNIMNNILDFTKIESKKMELENIEINPFQEFNKIFQQFEEDAKQKEINFTLHVDEKIPKALSVDFKKLAQVISNLVSNALKFTPKGGNIHLDIKYHSTNKELCISIEDDGIGIDDEKQNLIFEPFSQSDTSAIRQFGGTGLGLTIAKQLVILMGGTIQLDTTTQKGAKFTFTIKIDQYN